MKGGKKTGLMAKAGTQSVLASLISIIIGLAAGAQSSRKRCQSIKLSLEKIKVYARGWLNYYGIASMKNNIDDINGWLYHRIRMCIWKQWKKPRTKYKNLVKLGIPEHYAATIANSRRKYWYISNNKAVIWALNKERLINSGFYDLATAYQSVHVNY